MAARSSSPLAAMLSPPRKSVELEDAGARDLESSEGEDEHFSDASEGHPSAQVASGRNSPIPITRVEKVDDAPSHGEVPGTPAYELRKADAVPDEIDLAPEIIRSNRSSRSISDLPLTPGGTPIPKTVVEKIDPSTPSHGDIPGTPAYEIRKADAAPDVILKAPEPGKRGAPLQFEPGSDLAERPIPKTMVSRADSLPNQGNAEDIAANEIRKAHAALDAEELGIDRPRSPTSINRSLRRSHLRRKESLNIQQSSNVNGLGLDGSNDEADDGFGDEFDDFEEGGGEDDFGDFDDGFEEPAEGKEPESARDVEPQPTTPMTSSLPSFADHLCNQPLLDFSDIDTLPDLLEASDSHLDFLFPSTIGLSSRSAPPPIDDAKAIFTTERSLSLWSQLVAPPPLQPPNWIKSRIRRLFLVSLGVPIDLDEILPASKQKKLILPSINLEGARSSTDGQTGPRGSAAVGSVARLKQGENANASTGSVDSSASASRAHRRRRGPPPPPELDMSAVRRVCGTTDEALDGLADDELKDHVKILEEMTEKASEVLEYWLKMRDGKKGDKEAFEGVIENLVRHARRVRK